MPEGAKAALAALRRSHDEFSPQVEGLDAAGLEAQSACSEWTVAEVLSHLGAGAEIGLNTLTTGKADMDASPAIWDRWNAMSPADKAANFVAADRRLVEAYESLDEDVLASRKIDVGFLPAPVDIMLVLSMRTSEVALHRWDVEVVSNPGATVAVYLLPAVLDQLPMFAGYFAKPTGTTGLLEVSTTDPARSYRLELREDGASLEEASSGGASTRLTLPAEAFLRLTSGRLAPERTPPSVSIEGELTLDDLRRVFPGY